MPREDFEGLAGISHLAAGGESPPLRAHHAAVESFLVDKAGGYEGRSRLYEVYRSTKRSVADLLGADPGDVAFLLNASDGINAIARSIDWRRGDNVVIEQFEYPSVVYPWSWLRSIGVEVRTVTATGWTVRTSDTIDAIDDRTRVVAVSQVNYLTGHMHDIEPIARAARARGSLMLVDASHAAGVAAVPASEVDFLVTCSYKFLLASHGVGILLWNQRRAPVFVPPSVGWSSTVRHAPVETRLEYDLKPDAGRIETGNPSHVSIHILEASVRYLLAVGIDPIQGYIRDLSLELHRGLTRLGLDVMTPEEPSRRAANVCFAWADCHALRRALQDDGVLVWAEEGRIRISLHGYTDQDDIARCLTAVKRALRR